MSAEYKRVSTYLSKSLFINGLQCHKSLYLHKYNPDLKDELSEDKKYLFESGAEIGRVAQQLFPDGINISSEEIPLSEQIKKTAKAIATGMTTLYEPAFSSDEVLIKADILQKESYGWALYEVKGATQPKDYYVDDIAVQYYVLRGSRLPIKKAYLVHINRDCVRQGAIEVEKLFLIRDITESVLRRQDFVREEIGKMKTMLRGEMPNIGIGRHCCDPYDCDFLGYCWSHIPEDSVFDLKRARINSFDLYQYGIIKMDDVPLEALTENQRDLIKIIQNREERVNPNNIKTFLDSLWYPLYFLDFETFGKAIPPYDGIRPYQQVPYQYSLHYLEHEGAELKHSEYLAPPNVDPREMLLSKLLAEIPDGACVLAYFAGFEEGILKGLAEMFPQHQQRIEAILENLQDLALPFKNMDLIHWKMKGSYSLKAVLPAIVDDLSYEGLEIQNGGMAMKTYFAMCKEENPIEIEKIRKSLLEYCKLDTLGMVRLFERMHKLSVGNSHKEI